jgi:L-seryl-tRNA(Ser) seleniumtransferase
MTPDRSSLLKAIPSVDRFLEEPEIENLLARYPRTIVLEAIRNALDGARGEIRSGAGPGGEAEVSSVDTYLDRIRREAAALVRPSLRRVINATGVVIHTNLGRAPIASEAFDHARALAERYSNLEYDLAKGTRGSRHDHIERLLVRLTGAEAAVVTNNCAAALLTALHAIARGREVIVSRGELIEIGGSFRLPEIMEASGARLVAVGTTNRTHPDDYRNAFRKETPAILKVHLSNFMQKGFTAEVSAGELVAIAHENGIPLLYDLGSGAFARTGPDSEPTAAEELATGADAILMSGDKLLGSVQAGIVIGKRPMVERIRNSPIMRAVRPDKVTLALLEATLLAYFDETGAKASVPVLRLISRPLRDIRKDAELLREAFRSSRDLAAQVELVEGESEAGGGAIGQPPMRTVLLGLSFEGKRPERIAEKLRFLDPPVIVRIRHDKVWIDPRTLFPEELPMITRAFAEASKGEESR